MSDAPAESDPLSGCASTTATVRAALLALWAALSDALRYVFEKLDSVKLVTTTLGTWTNCLSSPKSATPCT